jgi:LmbE family N-acetylglucosaminyl deacetylase
LVSGILEIGASDRVLVAAVHPDDESLAAAGLIQRARDAGAAVRVVFVTSGDNNPWPQRYLERRWKIGAGERARWADRRRREAQAALQRLGIDSKDAVFLDLPDQSLTRSLLDGESTVLAAFHRHIAAWNPTVLVGPSLFDLHPDHSACAVLLTVALAQPHAAAAPRLRLAYRVHGPEPEGSETVRLALPLTPQEHTVKRDAILCHASQWMLSRKRLLGFARGVEEFFLREEAADHPVQRAYFCRDDLRVHVLGKGPRNPLRPTSLHLVCPEAESWRRLSLAIPRTPGETPVQGSAGGVSIGRAACLGTAREAEIRLPAALLGDGPRAFVKLEHRPIFFDTAGWLPVNLHPDSLGDVACPRTVCVIPCYNVAKLCGAVLREAVGYADRVVAVDDGSSDETAAVLRQVEWDYPDRITVLSLGINRGKGSALLAGFRHALEHLSFDALVTLDGDGQHLPCDIPDLSGLVRAGADMAIGERRFALMPLRSRLGNTLTSARVRRMYPKAPRDTQSGLRAFSRSFAEEVLRQVPGSRYEMELNCLLLALSQGRRIATMPISTIYLDRNASSQFHAIVDSWRILRALVAWRRQHPA